MARLSNIESVVKGAGKQAEKLFKKQLSRRRGGSERKMNTFGSLRNSIKSRVVDQGGSRLVLTIEGLKYGAIMDDGISVSQIPYTEGSGVNKPSQYITGLALWCRKKFHLNTKQALLMAFRIARKRKNEDGFAPANPGWIKEIRKDVDEKLSNEFKNKVINAINLDVFSALDKKI